MVSSASGECYGGGALTWEEYDIMECYRGTQMATIMNSGRLALEIIEIHSSRIPWNLTKCWKKSMV